MSNDFDPNKLMQMAQQLLGGDPQNLNDLMQKVQGAMGKGQELQAKMAETRFEARSGGGMVTVVVRGDFTTESVVLDPQCIDPRDIEMLQDLIAVAVNEAYQQVRDAYQQEVGKLTGGADLPFMP